MADKVVDASAVIALMFAEPEGEKIAPLLEGARLIAPTLLRFEIVNACLMRLRRYPERRTGILDAFVLQAGLTIEMAEVEHAGVLDLGERHRLTGYDASYLWLAQRMDAELVTLDRQLARAAARPRRG
jgi:predicted nucleic acid-binding protein